MCEVTLNIFSGKPFSVIMKKWHSGVENGDILNPALYKQHHMKTRWSSNSLVQRGRSGALSVTLSAALRVRGKPLNEVGVAVNYQHFSFVEKKTLDSLKDLSAIRYVSIMWLEVRWILS